jgi:hypothetical protein
VNQEHKLKIIPFTLDAAAGGMLKVLNNLIE